MKPITGLVTCARTNCGGVLLVGAADLAHHDDRVGLRIVLEGPEHVDEVGADDRVAADADAGALADPVPGQVIDDFVGEGAAAGHQPDPAGLADVARE